MRNRKQSTSTNVLAVCDSNYRFTAALAGYEGSANDSTVWNYPGFSSTVLDGHWFLADGGYGLTAQTLTPYKGQRYHLREWAQNPEYEPKLIRTIL